MGKRGSGRSREREGDGGKNEGNGNERIEEGKEQRMTEGLYNIPPDSIHEVGINEKNRPKSTGDPHMTLLTN